jgi:hypothetical protein
MVSANPRNQLQNVLPNGNPFARNLSYDDVGGICLSPLPCYYGERVGVRGILANVTKSAHSRPQQQHQQYHFYVAVVATITKWRSRRRRRRRHMGFLFWS